MRARAGRMASGGPGVRTGWTPRRGQSRGPALILALVAAAAVAGWVAVRAADRTLDEVDQWEWSR